jgi:hypothetical protein
VIRQLIVGALVLLGLVLASPAGAVEITLPAPPCSDDQDALGTALLGPKAIQGGVVEAVMTRKPERADVPVSGLSITVAGEIVDQPPAPVLPGENVSADIVLPEKRFVVVTFAWLQDVAPSTGVACLGSDSYRVRALVSRERLTRYLRRVLVVEHEWARTRSAYLRCTDLFKRDDVETWIAAADCLARERTHDRAPRRYKQVDPPSGLSSDHQKLIESAALRTRAVRILESSLRRLAAAARGEPRSIEPPEFPAGIKRLRSQWRNTVTAEARALGIRPPAWLEKVGR